MNFYTYLLVIAVLILAALASIGARAEDTYNFYFQKAPGPVTVNQGAASASATPVPAAATAIPANTTVNVVPAVEAAPSSRNFFLSLGYGFNTPFGDTSRYAMVSGKKDEYFSGQYSLKGEYDIGQRFSLMGEVSRLKKDIEIHSYAYRVQDDSVGVRELNGFDGTRYGKPTAAKNVFDFGLGAAFHLVKLRATTFSLLGGMQTLPKVHYTTVSQSQTEGIAAASDGLQHEKAFYAGARLRLIADNVWGVEATYRAFLGPGFGIATLGMTFNL